MWQRGGLPHPCFGSRKIKDLSPWFDALRKRPLGPSAGRYITQIVVEFPNFRNLPSPSLFIRNLLSYSEYHAWRWTKAPSLDLHFFAKQEKQNKLFWGVNAMLSRCNRGSFRDQNKLFWLWRQWRWSECELSHLHLSKPLFHMMLRAFSEGEGDFLKFRIFCLLRSRREITTE